MAYSIFDPQGVNTTTQQDVLGNRPVPMPNQNSPFAAGVNQTTNLNSGLMNVGNPYQGTIATQGNTLYTPDRNNPGPPMSAVANSTNSNASGSNDPVSQLYTSILGRAPDAAGLQYWQSELASGKTLNDIANAFKATPEYQQRQQSGATNPYGVTTPNQFASSQDPYIQAAQQNAIGNLAGATTATAANRVNQSTPYGSLQYTQTGVDAQGNPIWSANQSLNPALQGTFNNLTSNLARTSANPFSAAATQNQMVGQGPSFDRIGAAPTLQTKLAGTGMEGWDKANELMMTRLQPQIDRSNAALEARLANQGIRPGTQAYNTAKLQQAQANNDLSTQAQLAGSQVQNQMFNQYLNAGQFGNQALTAQNTMGLQNTGFNNAATQQGYANQLAGTQLNNQALQNNFTQNLAAYNNPLTQLGAFNQATQPGYVNPYNQAATSGPDYLGAYTTGQAANIAQQNYQNQLRIAQQNAANAQSSNFTNGLFGLAGAGIAAGGIPAIGDYISGAYDWITGP